MICQCTKGPSSPGLEREATDRQIHRLAMSCMGREKEIRLVGGSEPLIGFCTGVILRILLNSTSA